MLKNLAGVANCDENVRYELERCRISIEQAQGPIRSEVPSTLIGKLDGPYVFTRLWTYWAVEGLVPLAVAEELYADPVGVSDIRVAGHCGCPPPKEWAEWVTKDGKQVLPAGEEELAIVHSGGTEGFLFSDEPESVDAKLFVRKYHIDSEVGLRVFVETLFKHDLASEPQRSNPELAAA